MYTVASPDPDPDPNPKGGVQLPNHNECNSTLTSGANNIYPYPYIDVNDRVTAYELPTCVAVGILG